MLTPTVPRRAVLTDAWRKDPQFSRIGCVIQHQTRYYWYLKDRLAAIFHTVGLKTRLAAAWFSRGVIGDLQGQLLSNERQHDCGRFALVSSSVVSSLGPRKE